MTHGTKVSGKFNKIALVRAVRLATRNLSVSAKGRGRLDQILKLMESARDVSGPYEGDVGKFCSAARCQHVKALPRVWQ